MGSDGGVRIFTHKGTQFANCQKIGNQDGELLESVFLPFSKKNKDREEKQGTLGDALNNLARVLGKRAQLHTAEELKGHKTTKFQDTNSETTTHTPKEKLSGSICKAMSSDL